MRVAIIGIDTKGGIQPYLALGLGLRQAGHKACIVAPQGYRSLIEPTGLEFRGIEGDVQQFMQSSENAASMEKGLWSHHKLVIEKMKQAIPGWMRACHTACVGSDVVAGGFGGMLVGQSVAEKLGVPFVQAHVQPLTTTAEFPGLLSPRWLRGFGFGNLVSHHANRQLFWQPFRSAVNAARREILDLPPVRFWGDVGQVGRGSALVLYGYSPALLPRPKDWAPGTHVTGYWFLDSVEPWSPPTGLAEFLDAGPPPIAIGFGSMSTRDAAATTRLAVTAAQLAGQRAVLLAGWGGMSAAELPDGIYLIDSAPHRWLFPRCSLSVHHGGAGTTGAALRAGIPSVIVPFAAADQPFWAWLISSKGLGATPGPHRTLTAQKLAKSISTTLDNLAVREHCAELKRRIDSENGVADAVRLLEATVAGFGHSNAQD